jgi:hypothetical protein
MSKVIHLSDDAHNKAKEFCREHSLKMSDWVASLINIAIHVDNPLSMASIASAEANVRTLVQKKKLIEHAESAAQTGDEALPIYAAPPFWAQAEH